MKTTKNILAIFCVAFFINACQKDTKQENNNLSDSKTEQKIPDNFFKEAPLPGVVRTQLSASSLHTGNLPVILGHRLINPYTVANMQQAYNTLYGIGITALEANKLYVRFKPSNTKQRAILEKSNLELQDYPMDYELLQEGNYYQDASIKQGEMPWLYSVVPKQYAPPLGIQYEVITPLYIPNEELLLERMAESIAAGATYHTIVQNNQRIITRTDEYSGTLPIPITSRPNCLYGYHIDLATNTCVPNNCPEGYHWDYDAATCVTCPPGYWWDDRLRFCVNEIIIFQDDTKPQGVINIRDASDFAPPNYSMPLRQAKIVCKRWFKIWVGHTDNDGRFTSAQTFNDNVKVLVYLEGDTEKKQLRTFNQGDMANISFTVNKTTARGDVQ